VAFPEGGSDTLLEPAPCAVVHVDDEVVAYDPQRQKAHLFNQTAGAVWLAFAGGATVDDVTGRLADRFGLAPEIIADDVHTTVDLLAAEALLLPIAARPDGEPDEPQHEDVDAAAASTSTATTDGKRPGDAPRANATVTATGSWADERDWVVSTEPRMALGTRFAIQSTDPLVGGYLARVLDVLPLADDDRSAADGSAVDDRRRWTYRIWPAVDPPAVALATEHAVLSPRTSQSLAAGTVLWHLNHDAIEAADDVVLLHASAVAGRDGVLVLPAVGDSGKSTLVAALVRAGYRYVTDEAAAIDPATRLVRPYPKPIGLDPGSFPVLADLEPSPDEQPDEVFHKKWWLDPRRISPHGDDAVVADDLPIVAMAFPTYDPDVSPSLVPLRPAEGVAELSRHTFHLQRWGQAGLDLLADLATSIPLHQLRHNDLDRSLELLGSVIGPPPPVREAGGR